MSDLETHPIYTLAADLAAAQKDLREIQLAAEEKPGTIPTAEINARIERCARLQRELDHAKGGGPGIDRLGRRP
jgi:hypothetical protein